MIELLVANLCGQKAQWYLAEPLLWVRYRTQEVATYIFASFSFTCRFWHRFSTNLWIFSTKISEETQITWHVKPTKCSIVYGSRPNFFWLFMKSIVTYTNFNNHSSWLMHIAVTKRTQANTSQPKPTQCLTHYIIELNFVQKIINSLNQVYFLIDSIVYLLDILLILSFLDIEYDPNIWTLNLRRKIKVRWCKYK